MNKRPLLLAALFFLFGILYQDFGEKRILLLAGGFLLANAVIRGRRRGWHHGLLYLCIFSLSFGLGVYRIAEEVEFRNVYLERFQEKEQTTVQGVIQKKEVGAKGYRYHLKHCYLRMGEESIPCNQILVYLNTDALSIGNTIVVKGKIKALEPAKNQGNFDERRFYQSQKTDFKFYGEEVCMVKEGNHRLVEYLYQKKEEIKRIYQRIMGEQTAGVLSTMVLGDKEFLDEEVKEAYQKAGISHILAISGLHVSIIGLGLYGFLQRCYFPAIVRSVMAAGAMTLFAVMTGAGVSTKRAVCMFLILLVANLFGRSYDSLTALGFAGMLLLWENPFLYSYSGFLLSFLAVAGANAGNLVLKSVEIASKWKRQFVAGCLIQAVTIPVIAWCYFELPVYVIFVNLLILPMAGGILFLGIAGGLLCCVHEAAAFLPLKLAKGMLLLYEAICRIILRLPGAVKITGRPKIWKICLYYMVLLGILLVLYYGKKKSRRKNIALLGVFAGALLCLLSLGQPRFQIQVLDVGQGDGIYIESEKGNRFFVDGGSVDVSNVGKYRILPFLKSKGVEKIDYWFVSHCDADHISGLRESLEAGYPIEHLVFSEYVVKDEVFYGLKKLAEERGCEVLFLRESGKLSDGSLSFQALYPGAESTIEERNARSLVLLLEGGSFRGLLTGDIGKEQEEELLKLGIGRVDWYKAAHHGSKESNSRELLEELRPETATVSCGKDNSYGHPGAEALEHMKGAGAEIYVTAECGQITILPEGETYSLFAKEECRE